MYIPKETPTRDLQTSNTCLSHTCDKKKTPVHTRRRNGLRKETCMYQKETCIYQKRPPQETYRLPTNVCRTRVIEKKRYLCIPEEEMLFFSYEMRLVCRDARLLFSYERCSSSLLLVSHTHTVSYEMRRVCTKKRPQKETYGLLEMFVAHRCRKRHIYMYHIDVPKRHIYAFF